MRRSGSPFPFIARISACWREITIRSRPSCSLSHRAPAFTGSTPEMACTSTAGCHVTPTHWRAPAESPDTTSAVASGSWSRQGYSLPSPDASGNGTGITGDEHGSSVTLRSGLSSETVDPATKELHAGSFAVVVPAYNEGLVIGSVVLQAKRHTDRVIVVDDGSADRTAAIARLAGADVIQLKKNGGKARAMMAGFARARDLEYDTVVMLDGDGQHDPDEIPIVVAPVLAGEADLVIGSRFLETGAGIPVYRRAGQLVLTRFTNLSADGGNFVATDSQSGFRALSRRALENLTFTSEGYNIESDMIAYLAPLDLKVTEVPITVTYDVPHKHKKNPISHGFGVLARIVEVIGHRRPLLIFGVPGGIIALFGIGLEIYTLSVFFRAGQLHYVAVIFGITALILGLLLISSGLVLNFLVSMMKRHISEA